MGDEAAASGRPGEVARWMLARFDDGRHWLYQETVVYQIRSEFGDEFVYLNRNGNLAIAKPVLAEFRRLTEATHVWERGTRAWRPRTDRDKPTRGQV